MKMKLTDMTRAELLQAREFETSMLERVTSALMRDDATDETLELAMPLINDCKKCISEIDKFLSKFI
jgi:hypothetical protein